MKIFKGYGFFVILLIVLLLAYYGNELLAGNARAEYSYTQFKEDFHADKVTEVKIQQNTEIPTGLVEATVGTEKKSFYISDVNTVLNFLDEQNFKSVTLYDVARTPWVLQLLPYVFGFILIIIMFSMMSANAGGGGGGR